jgi:hypothetical protein
MPRLRLIPEVIHRAQANNSALAALGELKAIAHRSPASQARPTLTDGATSAPVSVTEPSQVVSGLGLSTQLENAMVPRVDGWLRQDRPVAASKAMRTDLNGSVHDPHQRQEIARRFWALWNRTKGDRMRKSLTLNFAGAELVLIADDMIKGAGHKYLSRVPTGKAKPKYRYIYKLPSKKGLVGDDELKSGTKIKLQHAGKHGHFEVEHHDTKTGKVRLKHDETGKTVEVKHGKLQRMVQRQHESKAKIKGGKGTGGPDLKLRVQPTQKELPTPRQPKPEPKAVEMQTVSLKDISDWGGIVGFAPSADAAAQMASAMAKEGHEYGSIKQAGGYAIVERKKADGVEGEARGKETQVFLRDSSGKGIASLDAQFVVMEADDVIASHQPTKNFSDHPSYPGGVQERRYQELPGEQLKVKRISRGIEPQIVANTSPTAIDGAPVVTEDGVVLGGNGRTMGMQLAHAEEPESSKKLKDYLKANAREFGMSAQDIDKIKKPILVRRVNVGKDTDKLRKLGRRMNEALTQGLDPRTAEVALGKNYVNRELVNTLVDQMDPDETLASYLHRPASNAFVKALQRSGIIDELNKDEFVDKDSGLLNEDGRLRVERVMAARMIPDANILSKMTQELRQNIAKSMPYLLRAESSGWDLRESLKTAVLASIDKRSASSAKVGGKGGRLTKKQYLANEIAPGVQHPRGELAKDPLAEMLFHVIEDHGRQPKVMAAGFRSFARRAESARDSGGGLTMFDMGPTETPMQALDRSFGITPETKKELAAAAQVAADEQRALEEKFKIKADKGEEPSKADKEKSQDLALSLRHWDDFFKAKAEAEPKANAKMLPAYLMNAMVRELNHIVEGCANVAGLKGHDLNIHGGRLRRRILDWLDYEIAHDTKMAAAVGAQKVTPKMIDGLIEAAVNVHAGKLQKARS